VVNWGAAAGYKVHDKFSIGGSFGRSKISVNSALTRYLVESFDERTAANRTTIDGSAGDFFFNLGVIVKPFEKLAVGGIYKKRPRFSLQNSFTILSTDLTETTAINFNIPSAFGLGISYRPAEVLTLSFDAMRIKYSDLTDDFAITFVKTEVAPEDYAVDDGTEIHAGVEYVGFMKSFGYVIRGGVYTDPDSRIQWVGAPDSPANFNRFQERAFQRAIFQEGDNDLHLTFGLGMIFQKDFQVDVAGNLSDGSDEAVASFVYRF